MALALTRAGLAGRYLLALVNPAGYGAWRLLDVVHGAYAFLRSIGLFRGLAMNNSTALFLASAADSERFFFVAYYALLGVVALLPFLALFYFRRRVWPIHRRALIVLAL